jgi:membrane fusion protein, macrolide-specific efflux system
MPERTLIGGRTSPSARRTWWRHVLALLAVTLGATALVFGLNPLAKSPATPLSVDVVVGDITQTVQAGGVLQPKLKVDIGAQVSGQVRRVHVKLGQWVRAGAPLVSLDPEASRTAVQQSEAQLTQQAAALRKAEVDLQAARREADRQRRLLDTEATAAGEQEQAATALARAEAEFEGQQAALGQRRADLADKRLQLGRAEVLAPIEGQVVNLAVQEGQSLNAFMSSPTLLTLAQLRTITVKVRVPEADIDQVKVGQTARFTTLAAPGRPYEGRVEVVQPIPERIGNAQFYNALFDVENADGRLLSDMTVQLELIVAQARRVPLVPVAALGARDRDGRYAVQVLENGRTRTQLVRVGLRDDVRAQVLDGLKAGDRVMLVAAAAAPTASSRR